MDLGQKLVATRNKGTLLAGKKSEKPFEQSQSVESSVEQFTDLLKGGQVQLLLFVRRLGSWCERSGRFCEFLYSIKGHNFFLNFINVPFICSLWQIQMCLSQVSLPKALLDCLGLSVKHTLFTLVEVCTVAFPSTWHNSAVNIRVFANYLNRDTKICGIRLIFLGLSDVSVCSSAVNN